MPLQIPSKALQKGLIIKLISQNSLVIFSLFVSLTTPSHYEMLVQYLLLSFAHFVVYYFVLSAHLDVSFVTYTYSF